MFCFLLHAFALSKHVFLLLVKEEETKLEQSAPSFLLCLAPAAVQASSTSAALGEAGRLLHSEPSTSVHPRCTSTLSPLPSSRGIIFAGIAGEYDVKDRHLAAMGCDVFRFVEV